MQAELRLDLKNRSNSDRACTIVTKVTSLRTDTTLDQSQKAEKVQPTIPPTHASKRKETIGMVGCAQSNKRCAIRESNPGLVLGKHQCYHYTNGALSLIVKK